MFSEDFNVRFYETDALGHVNNTVLPCWFETAREPIFKLFNPELDVKTWNLILASYKVDFLGQIYVGKKVTVKTVMHRIGGASFDVRQEAWQDGNKVAEGLTTLVHFNYKTNKSEPIPDDIRNQLEAHLVVAE